MLAKLQPNVRYIASGKHINDLANGSLCVALTYTGDALMGAAQAKQANKPFEVIYRIPKEGTLIWFDTMAIPVDAPHPQEARAFIDFMLRPESIAELTNTLYFANANQKATPLLNADVAGDPDIYPPAAMRQKLFGEQLLTLKQQRDRTRLWSAFRTRS